MKPLNATKLFWTLMTGFARPPPRALTLTCEALRKQHAGPRGVLVMPGLSCVNVHEPSIFILELATPSFAVRLVTSGLPPVIKVKASVQLVPLFAPEAFES